MKLPFERVVEATGATVFEAERAPAEIGVGTDTRDIARGDAFLALHGERFDGHDYTADAVKLGAGALIVSQGDARVPGIPALVVRDTLAAYMAIGALARSLFQGRVAAITGSAGKTTTKSLLLQLLAATYGARAIAAPANENNEIGVAKLLISMSPADHDVVVVEMGARKYGDVAALVAMAKPDLGVLTNVGEAHLEIMGSRERLAETKWALFGSGARAVLNADDMVSVARAGSLPKAPHWFAARDEGAKTAIGGRSTILAGASRWLEFDGEAASDREVDVHLPGAHNRANLAAAIAAAVDLGVPGDAIVARIPDLQLPAGRFETIDLRAGWRIIYDAYNANASGTIAALDAFAAEKSDRAIAVLGSMAELGDESVALHERVGAHAAKRAHVLLVGGDYAEAMARGAVQAGLPSERIVFVATNAEAAAWLRAHARRGDVVLLKGSRKYKLEEIVEELRP